MIKSAACLVLAATLFVPSNLFGQNDDKVVTIDHFVFLDFSPRFSVARFVLSGRPQGEPR